MYILYHILLLYTLSHTQSQTIGYPYKAPELAIVTVARGFPSSVPLDSMVRTISKPLVTFPNTVCFPFNQGVAAVQMKNWEPLGWIHNQQGEETTSENSKRQWLRQGIWRTLPPTTTTTFWISSPLVTTYFVLGPAFAMERVPAPPWAISKFSSAKVRP